MDGHRHGQRDGRAQDERVANLDLALASYAIDTLWLFGWWHLGVVALVVPLAYGGAWLVFCVLLRGAFRRDLNLRARDASLTMLQAGYAYALQVLLLAAAPQIGSLILMSMFIVASFSALAMTVRQFVWSTVLVTAAVGWIMPGGGVAIGMPGATFAQQMLAWLVFASVLARVVLLCARIGALRDHLVQRNSALQVSLHHIERLASIDDLTQLWNRRTLLRMIEEEALRATRTAAPFCLLLLDLDRFKQVNDTFGHPLGDSVLCRFAQIATNAARATDRVGRWGGEEFAVLLPATTLAGAQVIAERLRVAVETAAWSELAPGLTLTVSGGLAERAPDERVNRLILRCDAALYTAKNVGRNRVVASPQGLAPVDADG